ncbi:hypothetical protein TL16_g12693 [Triparma laevis f. inornata]|uniref:DCD domain-containing protein n=1 Tax=Triparma laevis f. inornata TaxID=1714386 RepID=A0A9W7BNL5_9STRA|nr:hypothetical protein TL16_g12693 [Triparma laevis f. inornata]
MSNGLTITSLLQLCLSNSTPCFIYTCSNKTEGVCLRHQVLARPSYSTSSTSPSTSTPIRPTSLSTYANFILSPSQNHTPPPPLIFLINYQTSMILGPFRSTEEEILVEKDRIFKGRFRRQVKVEPVLGEVLRSRIGHDWIKGSGTHNDTLLYLNNFTNSPTDTFSSLDSLNSTEDKLILALACLERLTEDMNDYWVSSRTSLKKIPRQSSQIIPSLSTSPTPPTSSTPGSRRVQAYSLRENVSKLHLNIVPTSSAYMNVFYSMLKTLIKSLPIIFSSTSSTGVRLLTEPESGIKETQSENLLLSLDYLSRLTSYALSISSRSDLRYCRFIEERVRRFGSAMPPTEEHESRLDRLRKVGNKICHDGEEIVRGIAQEVVEDCLEAVMEEFRVECFCMLCPVLTGLNRKEVRRIQGGDWEGCKPEIFDDEPREKVKLDNDLNMGEEDFPTLVPAALPPPPTPQNPATINQTTLNQTQLDNISEEEQIRLAAAARIKEQERETLSVNAKAFKSSPAKKLSDAVPAFIPGMGVDYVNEKHTVQSLFTNFSSKITPEYYYSSTTIDTNACAPTSGCCVLQLLGLKRVILLGSPETKVQATFSDGTNLCVGILNVNMMKGLHAQGKVLDLGGFYKLRKFRAGLRACVVEVEDVKEGEKRYSWSYGDVIEILGVEQREEYRKGFVGKPIGYCFDGGGGKAQYTHTHPNTTQTPFVQFEPKSTQQSEPEQPKTSPPATTLMIRLPDFVTANKITKQYFEPATASAAQEQRTYPGNAYIFHCAKTTRQECVSRKLFGGPSSAGYKSIVPGSILFLYQINAKEIEGPFKALSVIKKDIVPEAWEGKYKWQCKVDKLGSNVLKFSRQEVQHIIGNGRLNGLSEGKQQQLLEYFKLRGWKSYQAEAASSATDEAGRIRAAAEREYKEYVAAEERRVTKLNDKIKKKREEVKAYNAKVAAGQTKKQSKTNGKKISPPPREKTAADFEAELRVQQPQNTNGHGAEFSILRMWEFLIPADFDPVLFKTSKKILNKATNGQFDKDSFEEFVTVLEKSRSGSVRHGKSKLDFKGAATILASLLTISDFNSGELGDYRDYVIQFILSSLSVAAGMEVENDIVHAWNKVLVNCGLEPVMSETLRELAAAADPTKNKETLDMLQQLQNLDVRSPSPSTSATTNKAHTDVLGLLGMKDQAEKIEVEGKAKNNNPPPTKVASNPNLIGMMKKSSNLQEEHPDVCLFRNRRFLRLIEECFKKSRHSISVQKAKFKSFAKFSRSELRLVLKDVVQQYIFRAISTIELSGEDMEEGYDSVICVMEDEESMRSLIAELLESEKGKLPGMKFPDSESFAKIMSKEIILASSEIAALKSEHSADYVTDQSIGMCVRTDADNDDIVYITYASDGQNYEMGCFKPHYNMLKAAYVQRANEGVLFVDTGSERMHVRMFNLLGRYDLLGFLRPGYQASITSNLMIVLQEELSVGCECFASPLNRQLGRYCSMWGDTDYWFGSWGSFWGLEPEEGSYEVNPPFDPFTITQAFIKILQELQTATVPLSFTIVVPWLKDTSAIVNGNDDEVGAEFKTFVRRCLKVEDAKFCLGMQHKDGGHFKAQGPTMVCVAQNDLGAAKWPLKDLGAKKIVDAFGKVPKGEGVRKEEAVLKGFEEDGWMGSVGLREVEEEE